MNPMLKTPPQKPQTPPIIAFGLSGSVQLDHHANYGEGVEYMMSDWKLSDN